MNDKYGSYSQLLSSLESINPGQFLINEQLIRPEKHFENVDVTGIIPQIDRMVEVMVRRLIIKRNDPVRRPREDVSTVDLLTAE